MEKVTGRKTLNGAPSTRPGPDPGPVSTREINQSKKNTVNRVADVISYYRAQERSIVVAWEPTRQTHRKGTGHLPRLLYSNAKTKKLPIPTLTHLDIIPLTPNTATIFSQQFFPARHDTQSHVKTTIQSHTTSPGNKPTITTITTPSGDWNENKPALPF